MKTVTFTKKGVVNGKEFVKGDELRVSSSIFERLVKVVKVAVEKTAPKKKETKE